jgi:hypothetical protein
MPSTRIEQTKDQVVTTSNGVARNLKALRLTAVAAGKMALVSAQRIGVRSSAAARAAVAAMRGTDVITLREKQALAWNAAVETAAFECEQAAKALVLSNPTDDPRAQTNVVADYFTRQASRIRLLNTMTGRGRRFFAERLDIPSL